MTRPAALPAPVLPWLEPVVLGIGAVGFLMIAPGGPGWGIASANAIGAAQLDRSAGAPLYGALADVAAWIPVGEVGFRLAALGALLAATVLAGVVAATRALVPKLPAAGAVAALLLALAPPLHEASVPGLLAAAGAVWALAAALQVTRGRGTLDRTAQPVGGAAGRGHAGTVDHTAPPVGGAAGRGHAPAVDQRAVLAALGGCAVATGGEPWLGLFLMIAVIAWLARAGARRSVLALGLAVIGAATVALWIGALGTLPGWAPSLGATLAASGRGVGAIVVGAGLLGAAFAAVTGLPGARALLAVIAIAGLHAVLVAGDARGTPMLALLAVGTALIPVAVVRAAAPAAAGLRALGVTLAAGVPLVLVAIVAGLPSPAPSRDADAPARAAHALMDALPAGPGIVLTTRDASWFALGYAQAIAGERPDLTVVPPLPGERADVIAVNAMRADKIAGGDTPVVGRLDVALARPRGRGYQMLLAAPTRAAEIPAAPPRYGAEGPGASEARDEALERARYEASTGRLDQAARAAGLAESFGAADLAVLAATLPSVERPALFDYVPRLGVPDGSWRLDLFGDDLRWVGGFDAKELPRDAAAPRKLHALWQLVLANKIPADDPRITALGPDAVAATAAMRHDTRPTATGSGSGSGS